MAQEIITSELSDAQHGTGQDQRKKSLGPILCWAVVFADIGTSVYYVPGVLYQTPGIGSLAGFFVLLTMSVFVLLTFKYAEVTHRFPQGGGVVTVAGQAINHWVGALGGMLILVDYFLTAAISCLSGMQYLSVVVPVLGTLALVPGLGHMQLPLLLVTLVILILLGILNWVGISESATVSLVGAIIAFVSDVAILVTVFSHISIAQFFSLFPKMFAGHPLTLSMLLVGFAGAFLAFSGLESISQLSAVMKHPHKRVAGLALLLVVLTIGLTSPLLTTLSTMLLSHDANDAVHSNQIISLLAGHWGNTFLQIEVAISASALLVFASNTAIIGAYHVFLALSRMGFLPDVVLQRNKLRGTPHYAIVLATGIPVLVLILVVGNINILADMYAFGLLGAFTLTCLGLDIVRYRDWKNARRAASVQTHDRDGLNGHRPLAANNTAGRAGSLRAAINKLWFRIGFWLGVLTTFLVALAWSTNLVTKPLATAFGGGVTLLGMSIAYIHYVRQERTGRVPVPVAATRAEGRLPDSILAVLTSNNGRNEAIIRAAVNCAHEKRPVVFLYTAKRATQPKAASMMEIVDPYLDDLKAKEYFARAEGLALKAKIPLRRYIYVQEEPDAVSHAWQVIHPHDTVMAAGDVEQCSNINADRIRYELTHAGKVAHFLKHW